MVYLKTLSIVRFYVVSNDRMISEQWIGNHVEVSGGGLIWGLFLFGGTEENNEKRHSGWPTTGPKFDLLNKKKQGYIHSTAVCDEFLLIILLLMVNLFVTNL
jgi:hypothetical protein